jgi:hypothetical protein
MAGRAAGKQQHGHPAETQRSLPCRIIVRNVGIFENGPAKTTLAGWRLLETCPDRHDVSVPAIPMDSFWEPPVILVRTCALKDNGCLRLHLPWAAKFYYAAFMIGLYRGLVVANLDSTAQFIAAGLFYQWPRTHSRFFPGFLVLLPIPAWPRATSALTGMPRPSRAETPIGGHAPGCGRFVGVIAGVLSELYTRSVVRVCTSWPRACVLGCHPPNNEWSVVPRGAGRKDFGACLAAGTRETVDTGGLVLTLLFFCGVRCAC